MVVERCPLPSPLFFCVLASSYLLGVRLLSGILHPIHCPLRSNKRRESTDLVSSLSLFFLFGGSTTYVLYPPHYNVVDSAIGGKRRRRRTTAAALGTVHRGAKEEGARLL